jgi:hypothetical protein
MTMIRLLTVVLLGLVFLSQSGIPTAAQTDKPECDPGKVIAKAANLKSSGDKTADMDALIKLRDEIGAANIACNGLTFKGDSAKVIGPFVLSPALYKLAVKTKESIILKARSMAGSDCKQDVEGILFNDLRLSADKPDIDAEATWDVQLSCRVILEIVNSRNAWTITLEPLK